MDHVTNETPTVYVRVTTEDRFSQHIVTQQHWNAAVRSSPLTTSSTGIWLSWQLNGGERAQFIVYQLRLLALATRRNCLLGWVCALVTCFLLYTFLLSDVCFVQDKSTREPQLAEMLQCSFLFSDIHLQIQSSPTVNTLFYMNEWVNKWTNECFISNICNKKQTQKTKQMTANFNQSRIKHRKNNNINMWLWRFYIWQVTKYKYSFTLL